MIAVFVTVAVLFALVSGANDGATLLALGARHPDMPPMRAIVVLVVALMAGPLLLGTTVALAFTGGVADIDAAGGDRAFLAGAVVALLVVGVLSRRGTPTSLTVALVGGIAGASWGIGIAIDWRTVGAVVVLGLVAPLVGGVMGYLLGRSATRVPALSAMPDRVRQAHVISYFAQCLAYAANDGQKMLAVSGLAAGVALGSGSAEQYVASPPLLLLVATIALFLAGALSSVRGVSRRVGRDLLPLRPLHTVTAQLAASTAIFGSAAVGTPVSMTQSVSAGIVGVGGSLGWRRVRWQVAAQVALAWVSTLPACVVAGGLAGVGLRWWTV